MPDRQDRSKKGLVIPTDRRMRCTRGRKGAFVAIGLGDVPDAHRTHWRGSGSKHEKFTKAELNTRTDRDLIGPSRERGLTDGDRR
jgi:hypothetical protein